MQMNSILVTGGAGFIGSHTCLLLLEKGHTLFILDSFINSDAKSIKRIQKILEGRGIDLEEKIFLIKGDLKNLNDIQRVFEMSNKLNKNIDSVIHFAGLKSVSESISNPISYWENNLIGTINLIKIMEKFNCKNIVFSSSATVYKNNLNKLLNEDDLCEPVNPYGQTKLAVERFLKDKYQSSLSEWRIACLRYFNPVGSHESGLIGEDPFGKPNNLFPQITKVAIGELERIKIFGSNWPTPDGTGIRDYIHIMDLAEGHCLALNYLKNNGPQIITINLGTGLGTSVLELIKTFEKVNNVFVPFIFDDRRKGDNAVVVADNSLANSILNWTPKKSLEDICRDGWNWQLKNPNGY